MIGAAVRRGKDDAMMAGWGLQHARNTWKNQYAPRQRELLMCRTAVANVGVTESRGTVASSWYPGFVPAAFGPY